MTDLNLFACLWIGREERKRHDVMVDFLFFSYV